MCDRTCGVIAKHALQWLDVEMCVYVQDQLSWIVLEVLVAASALDVFGSVGHQVVTLQLVLVAKTLSTNGTHHRRVGRMD